MSDSEAIDLARCLRENPYPGRGIVLGRTAAGASVAAYFIMGRSENSRNRVFVRTADGIRTEAFDPAKLQDPSLILYHPVRRVGGHLVVTNGDQTDTVCAHLKAGGTFESALNTRTFEPDAPNFTPRVSGVLYPDGDYSLAILKRGDAGGETCLRRFFHYSALGGVGHFLHTYETDGAPLPSFSGEPRRVRIPDALDEFTDMIWHSLHRENKISLWVRFSGGGYGDETVRIVNKHVREGEV